MPHAGQRDRLLYPPSLADPQSSIRHPEVWAIEQIEYFPRNCTVYRSRMRVFLISGKRCSFGISHPDPARLPAWLDRELRPDKLARCARDWRRSSKV
jgi:hypothetical protein